jgi:hypothetical protein
MKEDNTRAGAGANPSVLGRLLMGASPEPGLDWQAIVELARGHRVSPLLFWRLAQRGNGAGGQGDRQELAAMPEKVKDSLLGDFGLAMARADRAERQLAEVVGALAAAQVPAMVVKGAALAAFYPDPALRPYGDLDLLVPRPQVDQAEAALVELGYRRTQPKDWALAWGQHLPPMVSSGAPLPVELHWRLDDPDYLGCLPVQDLWSRAVAWSVQGQAAQRLEAADAVLHLCRHAVVQHRLGMGLSVLCDLVQVTDGWDPAEWEALARRAVEYGLGSAVYLMLASVGQVLGREVPPGVLPALRLSGGVPLPDDLAERLFALEVGPGSRTAVAFVPVGAKRRRLAWLRRFLRSLFLPRCGMAELYRVPADSPRIWLTYLWRPVDLLRRYGPTTWDALRGKRAVRAAFERDVWLDRWLGQEAGGGSQETRR